MALSGTLDTFALPDVLRLLSSTDKTGRLRITGDRGSGSVWVNAGEIVATELASAVTQEPSHTEVVFGLLRFAAGSFTFETDATAPNASEPNGMEVVLSEAENMLIEWHTIEKVIPSLDLWVGLQPALEGPDVMIDQSRWHGIAAIGSGAQVGVVAETLQLNEIASCRLVKELMELGLVDFIDEPAGIPASTTFEPTPMTEADLDDDAVVEPLAMEEPVEFATDVLLDDAPESLLVEPETVEEYEPIESDPDMAPEVSTEPALASLGSFDDPEDLLETEPEDIFAGVPAGEADDELDPAEMARQLANLSPKAAKAVAAAARATTDAERDAALAAVEAEDDSVNRGLLLKFLGSVDS